MINNHEMIQKEFLITLLALNEMNGRIGRSALKLILKGSKNKKIFEHDLQKNKQYGQLSHLTLVQIEDIINKAINKNLIKIVHKGLHHLPFLYITKQGEKTLNKKILGLSPINMFKNGRTSEILHLIEICNYEDREKYLKLLIKHNRIDVISKLINTSKRKDLKFFINTMIKEPALELGPILFSTLIKNDISLEIRCSALEGLKNIIKTYPETKIVHLLSGLSSFTRGKLKKQIQIILND
ncbi:MAG: RQC domain-containing protein [Candidatus Helarchaeota archaeon]